MFRKEEKIFDACLSWALAPLSPPPHGELEGQGPSYEIEPVVCLNPDLRYDENDDS